MADRRRELGALGEELAARKLERSGCRVFERNFRTRRGELDLIAVSSSAIIFCEVKTRVRGVSGDGLPALTAVGAAKRRRLRRLAGEWLHGRAAGSERPHRPELRFDAIGVELAPDGRVLAIEHVENAF
jgi:putative endonuclease